MVEVKKKKSGLVKPTLSQKMALDMSQLYLDSTSILHCDKCKERMGAFHIIRYALFKRKGTPYNVPCKNCGHLNPREKGKYKADVNQKWKDFKFEQGK